MERLVIISIIPISGSSSRRSGQDAIYTIANGFIWRYVQEGKKLNKKVTDGYPKRLGEVFQHANTKIAGAFDTGYYVYLIREDYKDGRPGEVLKYKYSNGFR